MSNLTTNFIPTIKKAAERIEELHNFLLKLAELDGPYQNPIGDAEPLISFNGYYALNDTGAFLTVDTNLLVKNGVATPHVALIYSKDGVASKVYHLTGPNRDFENVTWSGTTLTAQAGIDSGVPNFTLTFTREDNDQEITSTFQGTITEGAAEVIVSISGKTYNNPIPMAMYAGAYYDNKGEGAKILEIGTDNTLQYNYNNTILSKGHLQEVEVFIYNLNMYVFSFSALVGLFNYSIIMGTSAKGGMVCNDLFSLKDTKFSYPRSLQTVTTAPVVIPAEGTNAASEALADFAGFYHLSPNSEVFKNAFFSIEGEYKTTVVDNKINKAFTVTIGISLDGTSSTVYTFDSRGTFTQSGDTWTLTMPITSITDPNVENLTINFTRQYENAYPKAGSFYGSVVSISGSYNGASFTGTTLLNVVPLMAFSGAPLKVKSTSSDTIVIKSDSEIEYLGVSYKTLSIVPLMYIVGFIDQNEDEVILSLGTDGGKGNTCLTTVTGTKLVDGKRVATGFPKTIELYTAIPDGDSGAPKH
jgi:hypothetical protein